MVTPFKSTEDRPIDDSGDPLFDEAYPVASSMECTGLIPAAPASPSELDSYSAIYDIPLAKKPQEAQHTIKRAAQPHVDQ